MRAAGTAEDNSEGPVPWDKSRRSLRARIYLCVHLRRRHGVECRRLGYEEVTKREEKRERMRQNPCCNKGWLGRGGKHEFENFLWGPLASCKRHPPFISAPCRPKPNLHSCTLAQRAYAYAWDRWIARGTGGYTAARPWRVCSRSLFTRQTRTTRINLRDQFLGRLRALLEYRDRFVSRPSLCRVNRLANRPIRPRARCIHDSRFRIQQR